MIHPRIKRVLISEQEIQSAVQRLGREIQEYYQESSTELIVVGLLRGSFIFQADLVREISLDLRTDFMTVSSYGSGTESSGDVKIVMDLGESIEGRDVLLVEDIVDTGNTLSRVISLLEGRLPASLRVCSLLNKPSRRVVEVPVDFCGFEIEDEFVVGYGLDLDQKFRNLPYVGVCS